MLTHVTEPSYNRLSKIVYLSFFEYTTAFTASSIYDWLMVVIKSKFQRNSLYTILLIFKKLF